MKKGNEKSRRCDHSRMKTATSIISFDSRVRVFVRCMWCHLFDDIIVKLCESQRLKGVNHHET